MVQIAIQLRAMQLAMHNAHHFCSRVVFLQDHEFFAEVYSFAEDSYDSVIERMIGLGKESELNMGLVIDQVASLVKAAPVQAKENKEYYLHLLKMIQSCKSQIEQACKVPGTSQGTIQMLGNIADKFEVFEYKIKQRTK